MQESPHRLLQLFKPSEIVFSVNELFGFVIYTSSLPRRSERCHYFFFHPISEQGKRLNEKKKPQTQPKENKTTLEQATRKIVNIYSHLCVHPGLSLFAVCTVVMLPSHAPLALVLIYS
jgi:hypothetical protein